MVIRGNMFLITILNRLILTLYFLLQAYRNMQPQFKNILWIPKLTIPDFEAENRCCPVLHTQTDVTHLLTGDVSMGCVQAGTKASKDAIHPCICLLAHTTCLC